MNSIKRLMRVSGFFISLLVAKFCAVILTIFSRKRYSDIWIISERGYDARDNGYYFYQYMRRVHPEQQVRYIIDTHSSDYSRFLNDKNVIDYESFKHFLYYELCSVRISTHSWGGDLPKADYFKKASWLLRKKKTVFLQHGVIKDRLPNLYAENNPVDIFICGALPEFEFIDKEFHYSSGIVQYTGLARFDNLHEVKTKNQILVMPTFRRWLQNINEAEMADSDYVHVYNTMLNDSELNDLIEKKDLDLIFYPHYEMQKYIDLFHTSCSRIKIAKFQDYDVQQLLIESKLLVTDFSSVFFDFGYMGKPVVYYQFDREHYIRDHYDFTQGYFSYDKDGFGEVIFNIDDLLEIIKQYVENHFTLKEEYKKRIDAFFPLKDTNNCERIYNRIVEIQ